MTVARLRHMWASVVRSFPTPWCRPFSVRLQMVFGNRGVAFNRTIKHMQIHENSFARLVQVIQELSLVRSLNDLMAIVTREARCFANADGTTFVLKDGDRCHYADENAISPLWKGQKFAMKLCISGWVMVNRQVAVIEDIFRDPRIPVDAYRPTFVRSLAMVPIRMADPVGAIGIYWARKHRATPDEIALLQALADSVSVVIENINLYNQLKMRLVELENANRGKDEFLMILSHELRTPLNSILGFATLLADGQIDEETRKLAAKTIEMGAKTQSRIINDILDTTRIVSGRFSLDKKMLDPAQLIKFAVASVREMAGKKMIDIVTTVPVEPMGTLLGDEERLQQIMTNLLTNAIKFTPQGGRIAVQMERAGPNLHLQVKDNGEGMDSAQLPRIFDMFYQVDRSSTRRQGGLGLGLAIVKHLVESHGGRIAASSSGLGEGAVFDVWLPLATLAKEATPLAGSLATNSLAGVRVLVVDDDPDAQVLVDLVLSQYGAEVTAVGDTREAMEVLMKGRKDILICDYNMPGEDGFSFMKRLRTRGIYAEVKLPAIALTAYADKEHEKSAIAAGFDAFVGKPLQPTILAGAALKLLRRAD